MDIGVREIDKWHRQRGFLKVGYHFVIRRNGIIEEGRNIDMPGAHVRGFNHRSIGVCLVGGMAPKVKGEEQRAECNYTPEQWNSLRGLLVELQEKYPDTEIVGHNELDNRKECPVFDVQMYLNGADF